MRCEDLRLGQTVAGLRVHSFLGKGPFFRCYLADEGGADWKVYAWELPTPPRPETIAVMQQLGNILRPLEGQSVQPTRGPFFFAEGELGWASRDMEAQTLSDSATHKASVLLPTLATAARHLAQLAEKGVLHPNLHPSQIYVGRQQVLIGGFFSWRNHEPSLAALLSAEDRSFVAPEGLQDTASMVYSLAKMAGSYLPTSAQRALSEDPKERPSLQVFAEYCAAATPSWLGRFLGR
jgi:hypothetical protein